MRLVRQSIKPPVQARRPIGIYVVEGLLKDSPWRVLFKAAYTPSGCVSAWYKRWATHRGFPTKKRIKRGWRSLRELAQAIDRGEVAA
jgi:hypothetical protein